jgi:hypothetical protein
MEQLELEYEAFATEEQVARLAEAFKLACNFCYQASIVEYQTNPNKPTYHNTEGWASYFLEIALARKPKIVEVCFAVDPSYPLSDKDWE